MVIKHHAQLVEMHEFLISKGLVTNYEEGGGATKREWGGGAREVLPLRKGGAQKVLAMLKGGGGTKSFGVVFMR